MTPLLKQGGESIDIQYTIFLLLFKEEPEYRGSPDRLVGREVVGFLDIPGLSKKPYI
jgi:hypothetical protein